MCVVVGFLVTIQHEYDLECSLFLQAFLTRFEALPAIKAYMSSDEFMRWPINNKIAKWGGGGSA